jgi:hypothetical protein
MYQCSPTDSYSTVFNLSWNKWNMQINPLLFSSRAYFLHYITPMVDLLFMRWYMRCKDVFASDMWVYVHVTLFLCACSGQTSMLGLVRSVCALVRVIWWLVSGCYRNLWISMVFTFLWFPHYGEWFTLH